MAHNDGGKSLLDVIEQYALRGPREVHHTGAPLIRKNASAQFLAMRVDDITPQDFRAELLRYLSAGLPRRSNGVRFVTDFNRLMDFAVHEGYRRVPFQPIPHPAIAKRAPAPLKPDQRDRLLRALDVAYQGDLPIRIVVRALICLGLDVGEATRFDPSKTTVAKGYYVTSDVRGRLRHIPIPRDMQVLLARAQHLNVLWDGKSKRWVILPRITKAVVYLGNLIGVDGLTPYQLKRTATHGR